MRFLRKGRFWKRQTKRKGKRSGLRLEFFWFWNWGVWGVGLGLGIGFEAFDLNLDERVLGGFVGGRKEQTLILGFGFSTIE